METAWLSSVEICVYLWPMLFLSLRSLWLDLHILHIQLQSNFAIPAIHFQLVREIDALIGAWHLPGLFHTAPPDSLERGIVRAGDAQLQMLLLNYLGLAYHAKTAGGENGPRIPGAKRFERPQFLRQLKRHLSRLHLGINVQSRKQVLFSQARRRMFVQAPAKLGYLAAPNRQTGRVRMSAEL